tara:strand:+ start:62 stop:517 length:456 start_codon:yes stop_codon:yes gene_type:complete
MADFVSEWTKGFETTPGVPSRGYDYMTFTWNKTSGSSHAPLTSDIFPIHQDEATIVVNIGVASITSGTSMTVSLLGSNNKDLAVDKWESVRAVSFNEAAISGTQCSMQVNFAGGSVSGDPGRHMFYKLQLDPNQDPGQPFAVTVGIIPGKS